MENQKSYYAVIPATVRYDKNLKANAKLLYGEITALCNEKGYCWATNKYFADLYEVEERAIQKWLTDLIDAGYITRKMSENNRVRYLCVNDCVRVNKKTPQGEQKDTLKGEQKDTLNTTIFNNTYNNTDTVVSNDTTTAGEVNSPSPLECDETELLYDGDNNFLGAVSKPKKEKVKKKTLYQKCVDEIDQFTQNVKLNTILNTYLQFRLSIKDKPIKSVNIWKFMLDKLLEFPEEDRQAIVQQSIDKGWLSFYPLSKAKYEQDKFSECGVVSSEPEKMSIEERKELLKGTEFENGF